MQRDKGLSTFGIIIALIVVSFIAYLLVPQIINPQKRNVSDALADLKTISMALESYKNDNHFYPSDEQGLNALVHEPTIPPIPQNWSPYLNEIPSDPWGNPYQYQNVNGQIRLWSTGDGSTIVEYKP